MAKKGFGSDRERRAFFAKNGSGVSETSVSCGCPVMPVANPQPNRMLAARTPKKSVYEKLEDIVREQSFQQISFPDLKVIEDAPNTTEDEHVDLDPKDGMIVDMQTANMLISVIKKMNPENQVKAKKLLETYGGFEKMVNFGWDMCN